MSAKDESEDSFNVVNWIFIVLFLIFNWGAMEWIDIATLIQDRKELFLEKIVFTLPLNLSFGFAFILAFSVKKYKHLHFAISTLFFTIITTVFNSYGWLKPAIKINDSSTPLRRSYHLLLEYFDYFGLFDFLSALLIAIYFTYVWHSEIFEKK